jgi:hypothetical protein
MDRVPLRRRTPAPAAWLAGQPAPGLGDRGRLVAICRAELAWARADWLEIAAGEDWTEALLVHERAAAWLLELWGHLHPKEHRLRASLDRLRAQRKAGWPTAATLGDVQRYRRERCTLLRAFHDAATDYRRKRMRLAADSFSLRTAA